jgi:hypothetical protein
MFIFDFCKAWSSLGNKTDREDIFLSKYIGKPPPQLCFRGLMYVRGKEMKRTERYDENTAGSEGRREFLKSCGRFAAVTPPTVILLLSTSLTSDAIAKSGGGGGHDSAGGGRDRGGGGH